MKSMLETKSSASITRPCVKNQSQCPAAGDIPLLTHPDHSYNWAVCEALGNRDETYTTSDATIKAAEIVSLRKLGVLRTDSCSEFALGSGRRDSILRKINALFV